MEKALLIEFDANTGQRAGDISPRDPQLPCYGWQDLESVPAREIRLVMDERDLSQYEGVPGVTILTGKDEINRAIDLLKPEEYALESEALFLEDLRQRGIKLSEYQGKTRKEILKALGETGLVGLRKVTPRKL